ncbi:sensor histidine kinase [Larkinella insperata]|uniref:histidine kinase n=1 Tax=Larkinella insperata TaxID=332158 RepID=A0ABW3Q085_9BACT|nr:histidine kinase [Larkinella insperata]
MKSLIDRVLQTSGLPMTPRQLWRYSFLYWSFFSLIWYCQTTLVWLLTPNGRLYYTETLYWLIELLFWWGLTPVIIWCAQRFSLLRKQSASRFMAQLLTHVLIAALLYGIELIIEHLLLGSAIAHEQGRAITVRRVLLVFALSFGTAFSQYMLLVVCYSVLTHVYKLQSLKQQNLQTELINEQLNTQLANAQLQALKMQLNPHFLFNTLHSIVSMLMGNQTRRAIQMVTTLSDLLRSVLMRQQANFVTLFEEMTLTKQYLAIQEIRFEDRLTVEYAIAPEAENCLLPQLILQPLVENAITHGIANRSEGALIRIRAQRQEDVLLVEVFDNGAGHKRRQATSGTGLGLSNTRSRLEKAYGKQARLQFIQPPGGTTTLRLEIPCQSFLLPSADPAETVPHGSPAP